MLGRVNFAPHRKPLLGRDNIAGARILTCSRMSTLLKKIPFGRGGMLRSGKFAICPNLESYSELALENHLLILLMILIYTGLLCSEGLSC